ncbi:hypothetical protein [Clostridium sp.]
MAKEKSENKLNLLNMTIVFIKKPNGDIVIKRKKVIKELTV